MKLILSIIFLGLSLTSCSFVEVQDYVHAETHQIRESMLWEGGTRGMDDSQLIIVPNFREYTPSFKSHRAYLVFVSSMPDSLSVQTITVLNRDTGLSHEIEVSEEIPIDVEFNDTEYFRGFLSVLAESDYPDFEGASELELTITYQHGSQPVSTKTMLLRLVTSTKVAWVT